jgi:hypothetical protein
MFSQLIKTDDDLRQTPHSPFILLNSRVLFEHKNGYRTLCTKQPSPYLKRLKAHLFK